jgi:transcriptional regulator with XRE-family HTH domain
MTAILTPAIETKLGTEARKMRLALHISQYELAEIARVSMQAVDLFENNLPLPLDYKRRILKELWSQKNKK